MTTLCFATNNKHKLEEVKPLLENKFKIVSLQEIECVDELPETQGTLEGNSLQKADFVFNKYNIPCFADDTGLEVEALNSAPGVHSAHYAGNQRSDENNIALLLKNLQGKSNRQAQFRTVITLKGLKEDHIFEGIVKGKILTLQKGINGFGYDSVFEPEGYDVSFAEMNLAEKNKLSHRARAIQKLIRFLQGI